jgi:hypothetical protein
VRARIRDFGEKDGAPRASTRSSLDMNSFVGQIEVGTGAAAVAVAAGRAWAEAGTPPL